MNLALAASNPAPAARTSRGWGTICSDGCTAANAMGGRATANAASTMTPGKLLFDSQIRRMAPP